MVTYTILSAQEISSLRLMIEQEFPFDAALQEVHLARKVMARQAEILGLSYFEYLKQLAQQKQSNLYQSIVIIN
jgi:hypothetical protein